MKLEYNKRIHCTTIWFSKTKKEYKYRKCVNFSFCKWDKPHFYIGNNGAKKKNGDYCFDFNINFFYFSFSYTNWDLQKNWK